jgi:hypothetical protein
MHQDRFQRQVRANSEEPLDSIKGFIKTSGLDEQLSIYLIYCPGLSSFMNANNGYLQLKNIHRNTICSTSHISLKFLCGTIKNKRKLFFSLDFEHMCCHAGHNGLVAAAYLQKSGFQTCVLEKRHVVGGAAVTEEIVPGFKFSRASYLLSLLRPHIYSDLELKVCMYDTFIDLSIKAVLQRFFPLRTHFLQVSMHHY